MEHLSSARDSLLLLANEDAMVGLWLLGIKRELVEINGGVNVCDCDFEPNRLLYYVTLSYPFCFISLQPRRKLVSAF